MKTAHSLKGRYVEERFLKILNLFLIEVSLGEISTYANFEIKIQKYEYFEKLEP